MSRRLLPYFAWSIVPWAVASEIDSDTYRSWAEHPWQRCYISQAPKRIKICRLSDARCYTPREVWQQPQTNMLALLHVGYLFILEIYTNLLIFLNIGSFSRGNYTVIYKPVFRSNSRKFSSGEMRAVESGRSSGGSEWYRYPQSFAWGDRRVDQGWLPYPLVTLPIRLPISMK